jgi:hypothetical protein
MSEQKHLINIPNPSEVSTPMGLLSVCVAAMGVAIWRATGLVQGLAVVLVAAVMVLAAYVVFLPLIRAANRKPAKPDESEPSGRLGAAGGRPRRAHLSGDRNTLPAPSGIRQIEGGRTQSYDGEGRTDSRQRPPPST